MASQPERYRPIARAIAQSRGIDQDIFDRQINQESRYNPDALGPPTQYGRAEGIAQIMRSFHPNVNPRDPIASLQYAAGLNYAALQKYRGDWESTLIAYNAGPARADQYFRDRDKSKLPRETQDYLRIILQGETPDGGGGGGGGGNWDWALSWFGPAGTALGNLFRGGTPPGGPGGGLLPNPADVAINAAGFFGALALITMGIFAAAVRSTPGQVVLRSVETAVPQARVATAGARIAAGGTASSVPPLFGARKLKLSSIKSESRPSRQARRARLSTARANRDAARA